MSYKPSDAYYAEFTTQRFDTGAATNADSTPTATANRNGTDDGSFALTVTNLDTGRYKVTGTVPSGYAKGDVVNVTVAATVNSVAGKGVIDSFVLDSKRVGDLNDIAATDIVSGGAITTSGGKVPATLANTDVTGNVPADLQTIKTQTVTCSAGVTIAVYVGGTAAAFTATAGSSLQTTANTISTNVSAITTNTSRTQVVTPGFVALPASGSITVRFDVKLFNLQGQLEDADTNTVNVTAMLADGTSASSNLGASTLTRDSAGLYHGTYTLLSSAAEKSVFLDMTYTVGSVAMAAGGSFAVAQADTVTSIAAALAILQNFQFDGSNNVKAIVEAYASGQDPLSLVVSGGHKLAVDSSGDVAANNLGTLATAAEVTAGTTTVTTALSSGFAAIVTPPTAAQNATALLHDTTAGDFTVSGSVGSLIVSSMTSSGVLVAPTGLDSISTVEPSGSVSGWNFRQRLLALFGRFFNKATAPDSGNGTLTVFQRDGTTTMSSQTISDNSTTSTQGGA